MSDRGEMDAWVQEALGVAKEVFALTGKGTNASAQNLPQPMAADCKPVHGKVRGPANHLFCSTHGHIIDIKAKTIIAQSIADYDQHFGKGAAASGGGSLPKVTTIDEEGEDIVVGAPRQTAMALPPQTAKDKAEDEKRKKQEAAQAKADNARLDQRLHSPDFVDGVVTRARVNCDHYKIVIGDSCQAFSAYADKKVKEFKQFQKSVAPLNLFKSALEFALEEIGGKLGEKLGEGLSEIGGELAKKVGKKVYDSVEGDLVKAVVDKLGKEDDGVPALEQAVKDINDVASRAGTAVSNAAYDTLDQPLTKIADALKGSGNPLDPKDAEFLKDFTGDLDAALERFGIPSRQTAKSMQAEIYAGLVKKFEENRIPAWNEALGDYPGRETPSENTVKHLAEGYAKDAKQAYQSQLDQDQAQRPQQN